MPFSTPSFNLFIIALPQEKKELLLWSVEFLFCTPLLLSRAASLYSMSFSTPLLISRAAFALNLISRAAFALNLISRAAFAPRKFFPPLLRKFFGPNVFNLIEPRLSVEPLLYLKLRVPSHLSGSYGFLTQ